MLEFEYRGGDAVMIAGKKVKLFVDPGSAGANIKAADLKDAVELLTKSNNAVTDLEVRLTVDGPGEYEVSNFTILGIGSMGSHIEGEIARNVSTLYRVEHLGITMAVVGNITSKLVDEQLEALSYVDILVMSADDNSSEALARYMSMIKDIEPKLVIPIESHSRGDSSVFEYLVKELSISEENAIRQPKLKLKAATSVPQVLTICSLEKH
ncbi:MAG: MBL fold metallo-hydrolase [Candidatus Saccharimonas sp.]